MATHGCWCCGKCGKCPGCGHCACPVTYFEPMPIETFREAQCWHCQDVILVPAKEFCVNCPEECDEEGCQAPGCTGEAPRRDMKCHKRRPTCSLDGEPGEYVEQWDSYACTICNRWLETTCGDEECQYCSKRPDMPLTK